MDTKVQFGDWLVRGFEIYKKNLGTLVAAGLIFWLLSLVSVFLLLGPMMAGMILIILPLVDGSREKADMSTLFKGFDYFGQAFLLVLIWMLLALVPFIVMGLLIPVVGQMLVGSFAVMIMALAMFHVVHRNMQFWPASLAALRVLGKHFWPLWGYMLVAQLVAGTGAILLGIGQFITIPIFYCMAAVAYVELCKEESQQEESPAPPTDAPPSVSATPEHGQ